MRAPPKAAKPYVCHMESAVLGLEGMAARSDALYNGAR